MDLTDQSVFSQGQTRAPQLTSSMLGGCYRVSHYLLDPLTDSRWPAFLGKHPAASVFHTPAWLMALQRTYNYKPMVVTTCAPNTELTNGVVFCRVGSLTGSRLVSLPFSDHCEPLAANESEQEQLLCSIASLRKVFRSRYVELRPLRISPAAHGGFGSAVVFITHELRLTDNPKEIYLGFSKDSVQRKIRRAEREELSYEDGHSEKLIAEFYRLLLLTRRRHQLPPQPLAWFHQLAACMGEGMKIRLAFKDGRAIAGIITLQFGQSMVYKYGCSDATYHKLGGVQALLWRAIQEAIACGLSRFDFGRSDLDNPGLAIFKDRWGASRSLLTYWTLPAIAHTSRNLLAKIPGRRVLSRIPDWMLAASGRLLYKHIG